MRNASEDQIRQTLFDQNTEFRRLSEEHSRCENELEQILKQPYVSSEDFVEESTLKKQKLRLKDQMEMIVARHR